MSDIDNISVVFMGTPEFAVPVLRFLHEHPAITVQAVLSQPDRKVGRRQAVQAPPVKVFAQEHDLLVFQPEKASEVASSLEQFRPDFAVVVAYGLILSKEVLDIPQYCSVNVHYSLLPLYRGASPVQAALAHGDNKTGVSIMKMVERLDAGDILATQKVDIGEHETAQQLLTRLSDISGNLLAQTLHGFRSIVPQPQDEAGASYCKKLYRDDGYLDFENKTAHELYNQFRALHPWPGVFTEFNGKRLKILKTTYEKNSHLSAGEWAFGRHDIRIGTKSGEFIPEKVQIEGKKPMSASMFVRGYG
jgi:methionyl-tRNA formyltransferase